MGSNAFREAVFVVHMSSYGGAGDYRVFEKSLSRGRRLGPGPTNMPSGAATTGINRILGPLLSGDIFVRHNLDEPRQALVAAGVNLRTTAPVIEGDRNAGVSG